MSRSWMVWGMVFALILSQSSATEDDERALSDAQLENVRLLLKSSNREAEQFHVRTRSLLRDEPAIVKVDLGDGGSALLAEDSGVVYEFTSPTFDIPEDLKEEDIASRAEVLVAMAPILKCYGLPEDEGYYDIAYSKNVSRLWTIQSEFPADLSGRPASLGFFLTADALELRMLWYDPPIELPPTKVRVSSIEARDIAAPWIVYGSPFTPWDPQLETDGEIVKDVIRGRKYKKYREVKSSKAQILLEKEVHLCWGVPFAFQDNTLWHFRVWVDVNTGEIIDTSPAGAVNR